MVARWSRRGGEGCADGGEVAGAEEEEVAVLGLGAGEKGVYGLLG